MATVMTTVMEKRQLHIAEFWLGAIIRLEKLNFNTLGHECHPSICMLLLGSELHVRLFPWVTHTA